MKFFDFRAFQNFKQMLSHDKIIFHMLFGAFHITPRNLYNIYYMYILYIYPYILYVYIIFLSLFMKFHMVFELNEHDLNHL